MHEERSGVWKSSMCTIAHHSLHIIPLHNRPSCCYMLLTFTARLSLMNSAPIINKFYSQYTLYTVKELLLRVYVLNISLVWMWRIKQHCNSAQQQAMTRSSAIAYSYDKWSVKKATGDSYLRGWLTPMPASWCQNGLTMSDLLLCTSNSFDYLFRVYLLQPTSSI